MTAADLLVHGGTLVTSSATFTADVGVAGGTIAAIAAPGELGNEARRVVDGVRTRGAAVATIVRGQVVMQDGKLVGAPRGRTVARCSA